MFLSIDRIYYMMAHTVGVELSSQHPTQVSGAAQTAYHV